LRTGNGYKKPAPHAIMSVGAVPQVAVGTANKESEPELR
jgi:hypothetical protein